ncbi:MAG: right-handed parallel beta-helix repeat-containing protein [Candidatus Delongbacteria bacterium]|nr:right-handed parallel beta-helix repeat-containing protein [Candidatus Delongbacteria bacterium]
MKKTISILIFLIVSIQLFSVTVDGYAFLEGETDHSGIEIFFQRVVPDTLFSDTVYTDSTGYYQGVVEEGWYDIEYIKSSYETIDIADVALYSDQTLANQTLNIIDIYDLHGAIKGVLRAGEYNVIDTLKVLRGDTLLIEPGVILNFTPGKTFLIDGYLNATGTEADSVVINDCNLISVNNDSDWIFNDAIVRLAYCSIRKSDGTSFAIQPLDNSGEFIVSNTYIKTSGISLFANSEVKFDNVVLEGTGDNTCFTFLYASSLELISCTITNFSTGIFIEYGNSSECLIENSYINTKGYGIVSWTNGSIKISNSIIVAENIGGEDYYTTVYPYKCNLEIYNSTIIAENKSAISSYTGSVSIFNSIISANIYGIYSPGDPLEVTNCDVQGQSGDFYDCGPYLGVNVTTNANDDPCDAYDNISMNPLFVDATNEDFRLQSDSPCVDAGTNTISGYEFPETDLDGYYRIWDGDGNGSEIVDMGAYEYGSLTIINSPTNAIITVVSNTLTIDWDLMTGANSYLIYSSDDPYNAFVLEDSVGTNTWNITIDANTKKFYQIVASSEAVK